MATVPRRWSSATRRSATSRCTSIRGTPAPGPRTSAASGTCSTSRGRPGCRAQRTCATCSPPWTRRSPAGDGRPGSICWPPESGHTYARWRRETDTFPLTPSDLMPLKLSAEVITLKTKHPFVIARGGDEDYHVVWVRLTDSDGVEGWGEADPSRYYGETADTVLTVLKRLEPHLPRDPFDLEGAEAAFAHAVPQNGAARAALSAALHDLVGKRLNQPVWRLWGLDPARAPRSSFTIGLDTPEKMRQKVAEASAFPILKIKLGTDRDEQILRTIRDATDKPIRVDANAGWTRERAIRMLPLLKEYGVEFVEQPLPPDDVEGIAAVRRQGVLPVVVDESCIVATDIPGLVGGVRDTPDPARQRGGSPPVRRRRPPDPGSPRLHV